MNDIAPTKILFFTGHKSDPRAVEMLTRYFGATHYAFERHHHCPIKHLFKRAWASCTRNTIRNPLQRVDHHDIVIGYRDACARLLAHAADNPQQQYRLVLIEPEIAVNYAFPDNVEMVTLFYNVQKRGVTMGSVGVFSEKEYTCTMFTHEISSRKTHHYPTWLWFNILRSRLTYKEPLSHGA